MTSCTVVLDGKTLQVTPQVAFELIERNIIKLHKPEGVYRLAVEDESILWRYLRHRQTEEPYYL